MERTILHVDMNNFYASVECFLNPELKDRAMLVCGDTQSRHGIVLAKNMIAKKFNIRTGEPVWEAQRKCPGVVLVRANFQNYVRFSGMARALYAQYTDRVEPFGMDESWLDVSRIAEDGGGPGIADEIRARIREELGITASVGVSFNKVFAKLGSDMKKPDATTVITKLNFRQKVWELPVSDLLYVGRKTAKKLLIRNICTIGDLANANPAYLYTILGKSGVMLSRYANGLDASPVKHMEEYEQVKSVGNSATLPHDATSDDEVWAALLVLSESVAMRLRAKGLKGRVVQLYVRDNALRSFQRQIKLNRYTGLAGEIAGIAMELFRQNYNWALPVRSIGVACGELTSDKTLQLTLTGRNEKKEAVERAMDNIRMRFGLDAIKRAVLLKETIADAIKPMNHFRVS